MTRPSVIIISIDALRADCAPFTPPSPHLQGLGLRPPSLPTLTGLVQGSAIFTRAIACSSYTTACHASLFTGLLPPEHGVRAFSVTSLSTEVHTLAEILRDAGYTTCAMSDKPVFFQPYGLLRGFQTVVSTEQEALTWWNSYESQPRFLFMHLWDAHAPYGMPVAPTYRNTYPQIIAQWQDRLRSRGIALPTAGESFTEDPDRHLVTQMQIAWHSECGFKAAMEDYIAGLEVFDRGRLADLQAALLARRVPESTLLVVTADHGEGRDLPPSRLPRHGSTLKDDQIRIPLYIRLPGTVPSAIIDDQASQADIMPTILDLLSLENARTAPRSPHNGRSLVPLVRGMGLLARPAYAEMSTVLRDPMLPLTDPSATRRPCLRYRILRYGDRKYWLVGKPVAVTDEMLSLPDERLVAVLFEDVLGRPGSPEEEKRWLTLLQGIPAADVRGRMAVVERFQQSGEFKHLPKYAIFDLHHDPLENKAIDARRKGHDWAAYQPQLEIMSRIDACARPGEPLLTNEADEQIILKRLQDLGYVE